MDESSRRLRQFDGDGAAKRRRLRRLRSRWRHEQQTVAAVLATMQHRPGRGEGRERKYTAHFRAKPSPPLPFQAASAMHFRMDEDGDVLAARPTPLVEAGRGRAALWQRL